MTPIARIPTGINRPILWLRSRQNAIALATEWTRNDENRAHKNTWYHISTIQHNTDLSSVLFFNRHRSEGWPHRGRTFSIYLCPLVILIDFSQGVLSTSWCCPSRPCMVFLVRMHLALFLALSLSTCNCLIASWCDHSMLVSLLWQCLTVPSLLQLCYEPTQTNHLEKLLQLSDGCCIFFKIVDKTQYHKYSEPITSVK